MSEQFSLFNEQKTPSTDWKWTFADYPPPNGLKVFSTFACGGGSTMGYKLAGCEVLGCVEIDPKMNEIYIKNHHPKHNFLMDLRDFNKLPNDEIPAELFDLDILDGSPPCTTFSMAGKREETWGKKKKFREGQKEQTLDDLSFVFIDTVRKLKPKVVIMENVEGLLLGEAWSYLQRIYKELKEAGYRTHHWLLKGEKMGIPQRRHRVVFVSIRNDLAIDPSYLDMSFDYETVLYGEIKTGEGERLQDGSELNKWLQRCEPGDMDIGDTIVRYGEKEKLFSHHILWNDRIMNTISAGGGNHFRGEEKTKISIEDLIHGQTFPEDYDFTSRSLNNVQYLCGMSVPPVMMKRVVLKLIEQGVFDYKLKREV